MDDFFDSPSGIIAGVDEVGRGPLAGDVVTAAVILDDNRPISGLMDSKVLTEKRRLSLYDEITENCRCFAIGRASVAEIDEMNILQATMLAMVRAVDGLSVSPAHVMVDGNRLPKWRYCATAVVKGDSKIRVISAASILAKVTRDKEMAEYDDAYPGYGFAGHKGYGTKAHMKALMELGPSPIHRHSFKPVQMALLAKK